MKELSLNILDIAKNSLTAGASLVEIHLEESEAGWLTLLIRDDGCGMDEETVGRVLDPFYTTRTTRKVGLGIPLLKLAAEQTGGEASITSSQGASHGTTVCATFDMTHIDATPLGDVVSTVCLLLQGSPQVDFDFLHRTPKGEVRLSTKEMRQILGDVPLDSFEVLTWVKEYLSEQYAQLNQRKEDSI
jgi:hypothetical protein